MARSYNNPSFLDDLSPPPLQLCVFFIIIVFVLSLSWYIKYESKFEDMTRQVKLFFMLCPLILLVVVQCLSSSSNDICIIPLPERDSLHRVGGSPWGVALLLVFLLYMISKQSSFHERWFPLVTRS